MTGADEDKLIEWLWDEGVRYLQTPLLIDAINMPGSETAVAGYIAAECWADRIEAQVLVAVPGWESVVMRLRAAWCRVQRWVAC